MVDYTASGLDFGSTYFWKVTEVQEVESWAGAVWSFATEEFALIDGFESYNDEENLIYETWIDGWVNETGDGPMIARVDALDASPDPWAKAGVMIRQDTAEGSQHSFMAMSGGGGEVTASSGESKPTAHRRATTAWLRPLRLRTG